MSQRQVSVAIVGAGMGGLAAASTLRRIGLDVQVYEQASRFTRIGAGIQMLPNSMKVLRQIGVEERVRGFAFAPKSHLNRVSDTGEVLIELPMPEERYGAPYLCMHRGDLHEALAAVLPPDIIHLGKKLVSLEQSDRDVTLSFADGTSARTDMVIGADGLHSLVRSLLVGPESPRFSGRVAYRAVFPAALMGGVDLGPSRTKWWGPESHIVIYYTTAKRDEVYFVTSVAEPVDWMTAESWSARGDIEEMRAHFTDFHPDVRAAVNATAECHKWAILERDPLPTWSQGRVALLGDACHPMTPYMAQGAAQSIEDAAVLARAIDAAGPDDPAEAFRLYEHHRKPRTSRVQAVSSANSWMHGSQPQDPDWLYGYDAWTAPLEEAATPA